MSGSLQGNNPVWVGPHPDSATSLGLVSWPVEKQVQEALRSLTPPERMLRNCLFVPNPICSKVPQWGDSSKLACHLGIRRRVHALRQKFLWSSMSQDIRAPCALVIRPLVLTFRGSYDDSDYCAPFFNHLCLCGKNVSGDIKTMELVPVTCVWFVFSFENCGLFCLYFVCGIFRPLCGLFLVCTLTVGFSGPKHLVIVGNHLMTSLTGLGLTLQK